MTNSLRFVLAVMLVGSGWLMVPSAANADLSFSCEPGCWGAIAASPSTGEAEGITNASSETRAQNQAILWCDINGKTNDCRVYASGLYCLALAERRDGKSYSGSSAMTQQIADSQALAIAGPGSRIGMRDCGNPPI